MGQKVNPHGLRVGVIKDWDSRWFVKDSEFGATLVSDHKLRKYLKTSLFAVGVPKIEIERDAQKVRVIIHCAKPGLVIGKGGSEIEKLRENIKKIVDKPAEVNVVEVRNPDINAQLVAESIAGQLERRISFRRAMKQAIARSMRMGVKGIKVQVSGLLGGADIARTEHYHEGTIPLQTIRADIDYGYHAALTKMGLIGIKVWIYKGEVLTAVKRDAKSETDRSRIKDSIGQRRERQPRFDRGDRDSRPPRGDRPFGGGNTGGDRRPQRFNSGDRRQQDSAPQGNFGNRKLPQQRGNNNVPQQRFAQPQQQRQAPAQAPAEGGKNDVNA